MPQNNDMLKPGRHELHFVATPTPRDWPAYKKALEEELEAADPRCSVVSIRLEDHNHVFVTVDVKG